MHVVLSHLRRRTLAPAVHVLRQVVLRLVDGLLLERRMIVSFEEVLDVHILALLVEGVSCELLVGLHLVEAHVRLLDGVHAALGGPILFGCHVLLFPRRDVVVDLVHRLAEGMDLPRLLVEERGSRDRLGRQVPVPIVGVQVTAASRQASRLSIELGVDGASRLVLATLVLHFIILKLPHSLFEIQDDFLQSGLRLQKLFLFRGGAGARERCSEPACGDPALLESKAVSRQAPPFFAQVPGWPSLGPPKSAGLPLRGLVGPGEAARALRPARLVIPSPLKHAGKRLLILAHD